MKTLQERLDEARDKFEQEQAEIMKRASIQDELRGVLEGCHEPSIHFSKLYGRVGSIHVHGTEYEGLRHDKQPDAALLVALLVKYPPVPFIRVKDGCTSFRPDTIENNQALREGADTYDCYGVHVDIETFQHQVADFTWCSAVAGELWEFEVRFPLYQTDLGVLNMRAIYYGGHGPVRCWEVCEFRPNHGAQIIKWGSGGPEYPNRFTLYWDRDSGAAMDWAKLAIKPEVG